MERWNAVEQDSHIQYGRTLTGDRPLAGLQVYGDPGDLAGPVEPRDGDPRTHGPGTWR